MFQTIAPPPLTLNLSSVQPTSNGPATVTFPRQLRIKLSIAVRRVNHLLTFCCNAVWHKKLANLTHEIHISSELLAARGGGSVAGRLKCGDSATEKTTINCKQYRHARTTA